MKTNIIKVLLWIMMTALSAAKSFAQTSVEFHYDANGNRILRQIAIGGGKGATKGEKSSNEEIVPAIDKFKSMTVALYPNPTNGQFFIEIEGENVPHTLHATLATSAGEIIHDKTIAAQRVDFDLTHYPAGIYMLRFTVVDESHVWKVIKK